VSRNGKPVCLLTGASGRFGTAFCRRYAERFHIAAVHRGEPPEVATQGQRFVDPLAPGHEPPENADPVFVIRADLTEPGEIDRVIDLTLARFDAIDHVVNAAARVVTAPLVDARAQVDSLEDQFRLNAVVPARLAAAVAQRHWRTRDAENRRRNRSVVNVSSVSGLYVYGDSDQSGYSASKAALNFLTCHMAAEFGRFGVRANVLAPTTFPALVPTETVVDAAVALAEGDASGEVLVVDEAGAHYVERG
jgi:NAD(P)-dependent dehydrogenase (short-subunit alcohol dehydrogenase family)